MWRPEFPLENYVGPSVPLLLQVRRGPRGSNFKTHGLPVDKNMRKKKKFKRKQFRLTNPMRNISEVLMAEAGELPDAHFRTNVQAEILCTGDTFRVRPDPSHRNYK